jgi:hypothetical protein
MSDIPLCVLFFCSMSDIPLCVLLFVCSMSDIPFVCTVVCVLYV